MGYQRDREEFIGIFRRELPQATWTETLRLLRIGSAEQRWNEVQSSIEISEREEASQSRKSQRRMIQVRELCAKLGCTLDEGGDPRGNPFSIVTPSGRSISVPGRGLPARCFA